MVGTSDITALQSKYAVLESAHREFLESELSKRLESVKAPASPKPEDWVKVPIMGKTMMLQYKVVVLCNFTNWSR